MLRVNDELRSAVALLIEGCKGQRGTAGVLREWDDRRRTSDQRRKNQASNA